MQFLLRWCGTSKRFTLVLLLVLGASGCEQLGIKKKIVKFDCGNQTVHVDPNEGANPQAVYVCEDDTVTWSPDGHKFVVEFKKDSPFVDGGKKFDNQHATSNKTKKHYKLTVYEYKITVDDAHVFDPQVIGGGGHP
jgi:hypothetical protein